MITDISRRIELCKPFGLTPSGGEEILFGDPVNVIFYRIRGEYINSYLLEWEKYIHPSDLLKESFLTTVEYLRGYFQFKYSVAKIIQPKTIVEIGVGAGNSAIAFVLGNTNTFYLGVDDNSKCLEQNIDYTHFVSNLFRKFFIDHDFLIGDSTLIQKLPIANIDLFHVDGAHDFEHAYSDCKLAFSHRPKFILVDDSHDPVVQKAAFKAYYETGGYKWTMFEDTFTGNILFGKTGG